jgi:GGDEF domain-containing protein
MSLLTEYEKLLHETLKIDVLEERMNRLLSFLQSNLKSLSCGIFLKDNNDYKLKLGRNISHTYTKNTVFHNENSFIRELIQNRFLSLKDMTDCKFEHECRHILVNLLQTKNDVFGFLFADKEEEFFNKEEEALFRIIAETTALLFTVDKLTQFWTEKKELDELTHIYRYKSFMDKGSYLFKLLSRTTIKLSVAVLKLCKYNDFVKVQGRQQTILRIQEILSVVQKTVRPIDICGKIFDDTYALIFPNLNPSQAERIISKIHTELLANKDISEHDISWGIAGMHKECKSFELLISDAEEAAFDASREETNQIIIYEK